MNSFTLEKVSEMLKAMGDPSRLMLLSTLLEGELSVSGLVEVTGLGQANVSKHLKTLQQVGLVNRRKEGTTVHYFVADPIVVEACDLFCRCVERRVNDEAERAKSRS